VRPLRPVHAGVAGRREGRQAVLSGHPAPKRSTIGTSLSLEANPASPRRTPWQRALSFAPGPFVCNPAGAPPTATAGPGDQAHHGFGSAAAFLVRTTDGRAGGDRGRRRSRRRTHSVRLRPTLRRQGGRARMLRSTTCRADTRGLARSCIPPGNCELRPIGSAAAP